MNEKEREGGGGRRKAKLNIPNQPILAVNVFGCLTSDGVYQSNATQDSTHNKHSFHTHTSKMDTFHCLLSFYRFGFLHISRIRSLPVLHKMLDAILFLEYFACKEIVV